MAIVRRQGQGPKYKVKRVARPKVWAGEVDENSCTEDDLATLADRAVKCARAASRLRVGAERGRLLDQAAAAESAVRARAGERADVLLTEAILRLV